MRRIWGSFLKRPNGRIPILQQSLYFLLIDQMPPGMRETLYFKDDDSRLSFLQGNYVTLTNMKDHDIDRIIEYHLAPINILFIPPIPGFGVKCCATVFAGDIFPKWTGFIKPGSR